MPRRPNPFAAPNLERLPSPALEALRRTINAMLRTRRETARLEEALAAHEEQLSSLVALLDALSPDDQALLSTLMQTPATTENGPRPQACPEPLRRHCLTAGLLRWKPQRLETTEQGAGYGRAHDDIRPMLIPTDLGTEAWHRWVAGKDAGAP